MKRVLIVLFTAIVIIGLAACGAPPKNNDDDNGGGWGDNDNDLTPQEEAQAEAMIEDMIGEDVDIDIDDGGDSVTINSGDEEVSFEGSENGMAWPTDELPSNVPVLSGVKVVGKINVGNGVSLAFEGCSNSMGEKYVNEMKAMGWEITMEMEADGVHMTTAQNGDEYMQFSWSEEDNGEGGMTYSKDE